MPIDKSWISKPQNTPEYANGLVKFLDFAFQHQSIGGRTIRCPCSKCGFKKWQTRDVVKEHLICRPFPQNYKVWYWHGEKSNVIEPEALESTHVMEDTLPSENAVETMINGAFGSTGHNVNEPGAFCEPVNREENLNDGYHDAQLRERMLILESQIQALCAYIVAKEGGRVPDQLVGLFDPLTGLLTNSTPQAFNLGNEASSPRSSIGSNDYQLDLGPD